MAVDSNGVIRLTKAEVGPAAEMMARAFQDYALFLYFIPDELQRRQELPRIMRSIIRYGLIYGEVYATSPKLEGAAIWLPSNHINRTPWRNIRSGNWSELLRLMRKKSSKNSSFHEYSTAMHKRCAPAIHMYLQVIGVDPVHQGKRYASMLLEAMFARTDEEGMPCYLMTQKEKNVAIYERHGFKVMEKSEFPGSDVVTWGMLRDSHRQVKYS